MEMRDEISPILKEMLADMLRDFDTRVPELHAFPDFRIRRQAHFADPATTLPGILEIAIMSMDESLSPDRASQRFLAIRVKKSPRGGAVSCTCFHGTRDELKQHLQQELKAPAQLLNRIEELSHGLPEETNPAMWR